MKRYLILVSVCLLHFAIAMPNRALAEPHQTKSSDHRPPLRLAEPDWPPLTAQQIREKISDHSVVIDENYEMLLGVKLPVIIVGGCAPHETFFGDGQWQVGICSRAYRVLKGRWSVEAFRGGERLCVEGEDRPRSCRFVWQGPSPDQIFMSFGSTPTEHQLNEDFLPYRIGAPADRF